MNFSIELFQSYTTTKKVIRHGYRKAISTERFLEIRGRCGSQAVKGFQKELDTAAGYKGALDNHCCYEIWQQNNGAEELVFTVLFHDDYVFFGKGIEVGNW